MNQILRLCVLFFLLLTSSYAFFLLVSTPTHDRVWESSVAHLASVSFDRDLVTINNIRNFTHYSSTNVTESWINNTYNVSTLETLWFIQEPFALWGASAHTFVSFGFSNGEYVAVSIEARFEENETYSALTGLFSAYELLYIWGTETDLIGLRTNVLDAQVELYEINTTREQMQAIFLEFARYTQRLERAPEFYHTLSNTCTSSLANRIDAVVPGKLGATIARVLPGYSSSRLYELGLLKTPVLYSELATYHTITDRARNASLDEYSRVIREFE